jgi:hypothetical protein
MLHLQSLATTNPHWARVVGNGPFSLCVIHNEGLCPSSGGINRLMMMMMMLFEITYRDNFKLSYIILSHFIFIISPSDSLLGNDLTIKNGQ